ncbi:MAG: PAS domain-containing transcriptional regulator [Azospirillaceae bacterium]|nr:PAS domain-containing transcriptional regulator [Azospirillaceae bacterium]
MTAAGALAPSFEYQLQRAPVGVILLDDQRRVLAVNEQVRRLMAVRANDAIGRDILEFHPAAARTKVRWLIDTAAAANDGTASMMVTTPMGSLVAKVTRFVSGQGFCMMFYIQGDHAMGTEQPAGQPHLLKLPVLRGKGTVLIDIADIVCLTAQGHYSQAVTPGASSLCPLPLAELERRVDPGLFVRVHRKHLVNLRHVLAADRVDGRWGLHLAGDPGLRIPIGRDKVKLVRQLLAV